jgi:hypothetical protein
LTRLPVLVQRQLDWWSAIPQSLGGLLPPRLFCSDEGFTMTGKTREATPAEPIRLDFESVQRVLVTDDNGDRWLTTVREAAQACRSALDQQEWKEQFQSFLGHIYEWSKKHADIVFAAYVGVSSEGLTGVIVTKGTEYRLDFDDEVTKLDIELAEKFPDCRADILQSPEGEPEGRIPYISLDRALQVYGDED